MQLCTRVSTCGLLTHLLGIEDDEGDSCSMLLPPAMSFHPMEPMVGQLGDKVPAVLVDCKMAICHTVDRYP